MKSKIRIFSFLAVLYLFLAMFITGSEKGDMLNIEKREPTPPPNLKTHSLGELPAAYTQYVQDHFPLRHDMIKLSFESSYRLFGNIRSDRVVLGKGRWLFLDTLEDGTSPREDYRGLNGLSEEDKKELQSAAEELMQAAEEQDTEIVFLLVPNKAQVYEKYLPDDYVCVNPETRRIQVDKALRETGFPLLDLTEELQKAAEKNDDLYFEADSHWTGQGACLGTAALLRQLGVPCTPFEKMHFYPGESYTSDLANMCVLGSFYPDVREWAADTCLCPVADTRRTVVVGDSFRYGMTPYLEESFDDIQITDYEESHITEALAGEKPQVLTILMVERNLGKLPEVLRLCSRALEA